MEIPSDRWRDISMDLVPDLPEEDNLNAMLVIQDRLTKHVHLLATSISAGATNIAELYFQRIFPLHGVPDTIVCDHASTFVSKFFTTLFHLTGTTMAPTTSRHQQGNGPNSQDCSPIPHGRKECLLATHPSLPRVCLPLFSECLHWLLPIPVGPGLQPLRSKYHCWQRSRTSCYTNP